jgi:5'-3' exonuclease
MLAIIDGDVLAYQACRSRYARNDLGNGTQLVALDENGQRHLDDFTREQDTQYMKDCWENFQRDLTSLLETTFADDYIMAVKGEGCYRKLLFPEYKMNRHGDNKPQRYLSNFVPGLRSLAVLEGMAVPSHFCEADDLIRIWAEEARRAGQDYVICSIDKDLQCIPGLHYVMHYIEEKKGPLIVTEDAARRFYYCQLIMGDSTDNIPGVPRVGPVKAKAMIDKCVTEEEMQEAVVNAYITAYPPHVHGDSLWFEQFLLNGKLIHIQTHWNDYFECHKWPIVKELRG